MLFPKIFNISLTSKCFLKCDFCVKNIDSTYIKYNNLDIDKFKYIIDEVCRGGTRIIELTPTVGDILSYDKNNFISIMEYMDRKSEIDYYYFYTSGVSKDNLESKFIKELNRDKLRIYISLYGSNFDSFQSITSGKFKQYNILKSNILNLRKNIDKNNINILLRSKDPHDSFFRILLSDMNCIDDWVNHSHENVDTGWIDKEKVCQYAMMDNGTQPDGTILLCTWIDAHEVTKLGNIFDDDITKIYSNIKSSNLRCDEMCINCDFYSSIGNVEETFIKVVNNFYNDFKIQNR